MIQQTFHRLRTYIVPIIYVTVATALAVSSILPMVHPDATHTMNPLSGILIAGIYLIAGVFTKYVIQEERELTEFTSRP